MANDYWVQLYVDSLKLSPLYIIGSNARPAARIGLDRQALKRIDRVARSAGSDMSAVIYWCQGRDRAELVIAELRAELSRRRIDRCGRVWAIDVETANHCLTAIAAALGIRLQSSDSIREDARAVVTRVDHELERLKADGGLKIINRSYREYRLRETRALRTPIVYNRWFDQYRKQLIRAAVEISKGRALKMKSDMPK